MLHKTRGIALHTVKFSETSIIAKIYTELFGLQSFLVKGSRRKGSAIKPVFFQPLSLLELTIYHKEKNTLHSIREVRFSDTYQSVPFDIRKSSMALFINELLYKTIREEDPDPSLFEFIYTSCLQLDRLEAANHFHLLFAIRLTRYIGIDPHPDPSGKNRIFNLREGVFQDATPDHPDFLSPDLSKLLMKFLTGKAEEIEILRIPLVTRAMLLDRMILYYQLHLTGFNGLKSTEILHQVLSE
jgi:DNA repair protein RecO (recombination protein O)